MTLLLFHQSKHVWWQRALIYRKKIRLSYRYRDRGKPHLHNSCSCRRCPGLAFFSIASWCTPCRFLFDFPSSENGRTAQGWRVFRHFFAQDVLHSRSWHLSCKSWPSGMSPRGCSSKTEFLSLPHSASADQLSQVTATLDSAQAQTGLRCSFWWTCNKLKLTNRTYPKFIL